MLGPGAGQEKKNPNGGVEDPLSSLCLQHGARCLRTPVALPRPVSCPACSLHTQETGNCTLYLFQKNIAIKIEKKFVLKLANEKKQLIDFILNQTLVFAQTGMDLRGTLSCRLLSCSWNGWKVAGKGNYAHWEVLTVGENQQMLSGSRLMTGKNCNEPTWFLGKDSNEPANLDE